MWNCDHKKKKKKTKVNKSIKHLRVNKSKYTTLMIVNETKERMYSYSSQKVNIKKIIINKDKYKLNIKTCELKTLLINAVLKLKNF